MKRSLARAQTTQKTSALVLTRQQFLPAEWRDDGHLDERGEAPRLGVGEGRAGLCWCFFGVWGVCGRLEIDESDG